MFLPPKSPIRTTRSTSKEVSSNSQQSSPNKEVVSPPSSRRLSVTGISLEVDPQYAYDDINSSPLRTFNYDSGSSTPIDLTKSIDYILRPSPHTHASILSFHKFLTSPECMSPHPPLFRNHVENYTLLYYAQSATQLVYLIRSNHVSYLVDNVLTFKWTASVFSAREGEYRGRREMEEYGIKGNLLVELRGDFVRERGESRVEWEELIASILKKVRGVERISAERVEKNPVKETAIRTRRGDMENSERRKGRAENGVRERKAKVVERSESPLLVLNFKENIFKTAYPNLRSRNP